MSRTKGAVNIVRFGDRESIETSDNSKIPHLANREESPVDCFLTLLNHQENFLKWLDKGKETRKDSIYNKYRLYASQLILLEAVNGFELFYKQTLIQLASVLKNYIPLSKIGGAVEMKVVWTMSENVSAESLLFEHQLFHDLENVDKATNMLMDYRKYNVNSKAGNENLVKSIRAIFQMRHTLSHNGGFVTESDRAKFKVLGYEVKAGETIDPSKNQLGKSVINLLKEESAEFTQAILDNAIKFLSGQKGSERNIPESLEKEFLKLSSKKEKEKRHLEFRKKCLGQEE